MNNQVNLKI